MHFKHPELLYALFLLVIPVIVHLFQLRRFRKEKFTNVKFLRKATLQTRKSSRIKKWLILCTRLLLLAAVILAFAQPYIPSGSEEALASAEETVIYLDNSYSMQAKSSKGILLRRSIQELLESIPAESTFTFFTNETEYRNITSESLRNDLQRLSYSPAQLDWEMVELRAIDLFTNQSSSKNLIAISDFQIKGGRDEIEPLPGINLRLVKLTPENINNISIDTAFVESRTLDEINLSLQISATGSPSTEVPVSLYNDDNLLARKTVVLNEGLEATTNFELTNRQILEGRIAIEDHGLSFDNELFFSINETEPIEVVVISNSDDSFLQRIFRDPEFNLRIFEQNQVDYNVLSEANLIVLNEPDEITSALSGALESLLIQDVYLILIPSTEADLRSYNSFFRETGLPAFGQPTAQERLITGISYDHPLYSSVFDERVENFQYPVVQDYYPVNEQGNPVLNYESGQPFLFQSGNSFIFTAALNSDNSNFQRAPLIVPSLYNIGNLALKPSRLYYILGTEARAGINVSLDRDEILQVASASGYSFIPRQQSFQNKVELEFNEAPTEPGYYSILRDSTRLAGVSFNINRKESKLTYNNLNPGAGMTVNDTVPQVFQEMESESNTNTLWKWFVIFALLLLLTEMLILKFFK